MKESKLHIVGLEDLDECLHLATGDPSNPDYINRAWFFMYCYKVVSCPKRYSHDWGACPYAHNNESARRRDPQRHNYSSCICPNTGKGECPHGVNCRYAHTLFEYWLHPGRFRTQMCKSGANCKRALCFFAHSPQELRQPSRAASLAPLPGGSQLAGSTGSEGLLPLTASFEDLPNTAAAGLASLSTNGHCCADSTGSNVSASTCQQGSSPTHLDCQLGVVGDLGPMRCARTTLQLSGPTPLSSVAAATAGLLPVSRSISSAASLAAVQAGPAPGGLPISAAAVVTSMPQLMDLLQQQQQQLVGMAVTSMPLGVPGGIAGMCDLTGLRPQQGALVANLIGQPAAAVPSGGLLLQPVQLGGSAVLTGLTACAQSLPGGMTLVPACPPGYVQQQPQPVSAAGLQVYPPGMLQVQQPNGCMPWI